MLMIWIIGFGKETHEDLGPVLRVQCPRCHNIVDYHLIQSKTWFSLFFIPLLPYRTDYRLICPICSKAVELSRESQVQTARRLVKATAAYRRQRISEERYNEILDKYLTKRPFRRLATKD
jgi:endogenous inhibitor of DNA gyrase (YacG/DUF329 family)